MKTIFRLAALLALLASPANSAEQGFGDVSVRFDEARWNVSRQPDGLRFAPVGNGERQVVSVNVTQTDAAPGLTCDAIVKQRFEGRGGGLRETSPATLGARAATRYLVYSECRNLAPNHVLICAISGGRATLVATAPYECRSAPSTVGDPVGDIAAGLRFN